MKGYNLVVLAAGMGSRFGGIKQLASVDENNQVLLEYSVYDAFKTGCDKVIFIIRKDIEDEFKRVVFDKISKKVNAVYVFQEKDTLVPDSLKPLANARKKPYGTVQAILSAKDEINNNFVVINADDFYSRSSYEILQRHFEKSDSNAIVVYPLEPTLSALGTVNRGICRYSDKGKLEKIEETYNIKKEGNRIFGQDKNGKSIELKASDNASMNFFGFNKSILKLLSDYWKNFVSTIKDDNSQECLLPIFCNEKLINKEIEFSSYTSTGKWLGMTYKEDVDKIKVEIKNLIKSGVYPERLY